MIQIQNRQNIDDTSNEVHAYLTRIQPKSIFPNFILIKNKGDNPPSCPRSSGSSQWLHLDINRTTCKDNRINNKEYIKNDRSKSKF